MLAMAIWAVISRWAHVIAAALLVGGLFFMRVILPGGLALLNPEQRDEVLVKCRRRFKMTVHPCILLILVSGTYNSYLAFSAYKANPALLHALWGTHVLLGLIAIGVALWLFAGRVLRPNTAKFALINLLILLILIAVASTLKSARETASHPTVATQPAR